MITPEKLTEWEKLCDELYQHLPGELKANAMREFERASRTALPELIAEVKRLRDLLIEAEEYRDLAESHHWD